jgi:hypothetical protein
MSELRQKRISGYVGCKNCQRPIDHPSWSLRPRHIETNRISCPNAETYAEFPETLPVTTMTEKLDMAIVMIRGLSVNRADFTDKTEAMRILLEVKNAIKLSEAVHDPK